MSGTDGAPAGYRKKYTTEADFAYAVACRRQLHRHPETGFDLEHTTALIRSELESMGIACGEAGPASVTGWIGPQDCRTAIGLRADMDALPIQERTGLPFASEVPGVMHACGHDAHTAVLLTAARILKRHESEMRVRVKLLFQPSEEGSRSGARSMTEHGAADDVDCVLAAHCDNDLPAGTIGICPGAYMAASGLVTLTFRGRRSHAAMPEKGVDAIAMAVEAYGTLKRIAAEEAGDGTPCIFGINCIRGGTAPNMIADSCEMMITFRYYDPDLFTVVETRGRQSCCEIAERFGGSAEQNWNRGAPPVYNDPLLTAAFAAAAERALPGCVTTLSPCRISEDFSWFLQRKPGFLFRFGTRSEENGCTAPLHSDDFRLDERGMAGAIEAFAAFVMDRE